MNTLELISEEYYKKLDKDFIKRNGVAYTPAWLADHISSRALSQWEKLNNGKKPQVAGDICCGTGLFLQKLAEKGHNDLNIFGYDLDDGALAIAQDQFSDISSVSLFKLDTLLDDEVTNKFDVVVANPPYVNSSNLEDEYKNKLKFRYDSSNKGTFDLSVIFVERIIESLKDGGVASIILSNKFMTSKYGKGICKVLAEKCNIVSIEDFNDIQLFKGLTTYTCILTLVKSKPGKKHTLIRYVDDINFESPSIPKGYSETIEHKQLQEHPWNFHSKEELSIHRKFSSSSVGIYDVFTNVSQGIRTGNNEVYLIDKENEFSDKFVKKFVVGGDIKSEVVSDNSKSIIYPYKNDGGCYSLVSEEELMTQDPVLYNYLSSKKELLSSRSIQGNSSWYGFSRSQGLDTLNIKKILIKEMMPKAVFGADVKGEYAFSSGYAFICDKMSDDEVIVWARILSTPIMEFQMRHVGTQLHSGWFRLMKGHINSLYLPKLIDGDLNLILKACSEEVNNIVSERFGINTEERLYISNNLAEIHKKSQPKHNYEEKIEDKYEPIKYDRFDKLHIERNDLRQAVTFTPNKKKPIHNWYKYTQAYSTELVSQLLTEFDIKKGNVVLDPFSGCGTTVLTCAYMGIDSIGIEISPLMTEVARIKSRKWDISLLKKAKDDLMTIEFSSNVGVDFIFSEYFEKAYSENILIQVKQLAEFIFGLPSSEVKDFYTIGFISILEDISKIRKHGSHYRFLDNKSSVGLQKLNIDVIDESSDIKSVFVSKLNDIYSDVCLTGGNPTGEVKILNESSLNSSVASESIDCIITSPPYLNRNNYISQQKAELDVLGLLNSKEEYKALVKSSFRSHTDSQLDKEATSRFEDVQKIINNLDLEKKNNPKIPHMICGYFDDLYLSLSECYRMLKKGGKLSFVVGNTRWGGVVVPIDHMLANMAEEIGFKVSSIYVTRLKGNSPQQMKKFGKIPVRESIVNMEKI